MNEVTRDMLRERFFQAGLETYWDRLSFWIRRSISVETRRYRDDDIPIGASKRWGIPDVPEGFLWPIVDGRPCAFLCQINLAEIPSSEEDNLLPESGILSFFHGNPAVNGTLGGDPVYYFPEEVGLFRNESFRCYLEPGDDEAEKLKFKNSWSIPYWDVSDKLDFLNEDDEAVKKFLEVASVLSEWASNYSASDDPLYSCFSDGTHLLGFGDEYQGDCEPECELIYRRIEREDIGAEKYSI